MCEGGQTTKKKICYFRGWSLLKKKKNRKRKQFNAGFIPNWANGVFFFVTSLFCGNKKNNTCWRLLLQKKIKTTESDLVNY